MMHPSFGVALVAAITLLLSACTTTDPYTGRQVDDPNATAALIGGLALGAAVLAASSDEDDDDDYYRKHHRHHRDYDRDNDRNYYRTSRSRSPASGVVCNDYSRVCYRNGHQSHRWTRKIYGI